MDTNRLPKQALQYQPKGRRNIGRPRKRWRDQLHLEDQGTGNTPNPSGTWWWWNNLLWKCTKQPRLDLQIRRRKWGWLGHALRRPTDDITRQALEWNAQGKRSRERPKNTWRRAVLEETKGVKTPEQRLSASPRIECGGGILWMPYVPQRSDGTWLIDC